MMARMFAVASALILLTLLWTGPHSAADTRDSSSPVPALPSSLDQLYPPQSQGPVLLMSMHGMNAALTGILVDAFEDDWTGVDANYADFRTRFEETSGLVPEWKHRFDTGPVTALGAAVSSREVPGILGAVQQVGMVCHHCHVEAMVPVQQKFHWPDFGLISVEDPILEADMEYPQYMQMLNLSLTGIAIDVGQGQTENARAHASALKARIAQLADSCDGCHDTPRTYFVDQAVQEQIAKLETTLAASQPDMGTVAASVQRIGEQSCFGCHLVHLPAAYAREMAR